jgi:hypothetical protein
MRHHTEVAADYKEVDMRHIGDDAWLKSQYQ